MEWYVLVLMLSLPPSTHTDCSSKCQRCAEQTLPQDAAFSTLSCSSECDEDELESCAPTPRLADFTEDEAAEAEESQQAELVKRYGGFIKRIDKNKNKVYTSSKWHDNSVLKAAALPVNYEDLLKRLEVRDAPAEEEPVPHSYVKRYGGFLRKFGPKSKRGSSEQEGSQDPEELQKRYGGFMRRVRPKFPNLKWDKRYGGYLRRHFRFSVRSAEEPYSSSAELSL
ncbi:proenkephalin-B [Fundulus diaphanus]